MLDHVLFPVWFLIVVVCWLTAKHVLAARQEVKQVEIDAYGDACEGRVVAIQRPFALDACTRLYFDYRPSGAAQPVRGCHVDRRPAHVLRALIPQIGSVVSVRYLPNQPGQAVIHQLVG